MEKVTYPDIKDAPSATSLASSYSNCKNVDHTSHVVCISIAEAVAAIVEDSPWFLTQPKPEGICQPSTSKSFKSTNHRHKKQRELCFSDKPFKCTECARSFTHKFSLRAHQAVHTGKEPHKCKQCGKGFRWKKRLLDHQKTHVTMETCKTSNKHNNSNYFSYTTTNQHQLQTLQKIRVSSEESENSYEDEGEEFIERRYKCTDCGRTYKKKAGLKGHRVTVHSEEGGHECWICLKILGSPKQLIDHIRRHTGEKPHECERCGRKFVTTYGLKQHSVLHLM